MGLGLGPTHDIQQHLFFGPHGTMAQEVLLVSGPQVGLPCAPEVDSQGRLGSSPLRQPKKGIRRLPTSWYLEQSC